MNANEILNEADAYNHGISYDEIHIVFPFSVMQRAIHFSIFMNFNSRQCHLFLLFFSISSSFFTLVCVCVPTSNCVAAEAVQSQTVSLFSFPLCVCVSLNERLQRRYYTMYFDLSLCYLSRSRCSHRSTFTHHTDTIPCFCRFCLRGKAYYFLFIRQHRLNASASRALRIKRKTHVDNTA